MKEDKKRKTLSMLLNWLQKAVVNLPNLELFSKMFLNTTKRKVFVVALSISLLYIYFSSTEGFFLKRNCDRMQMAFSFFENAKIIGYGKPFECSLLPYLKRFKLSGELSEKNYVEHNKLDVVIVTYSSANHYLEARAGLFNIRKTIPNKIVFFDLGLNEAQVGELRNLCNLEYVKVDLTIYPKHVQNLNSYAFKAIVIAESYQRFASFWVFDASIRIEDVEQFNEFPDAVIRGEVAGYAMTSVGFPHSNFAVTHPGMYDYLPATEKAKKKLQRRSGLVFVVRSPLSYDVIRWHLLCALTENCISPPGHRHGCKFSNNTIDVYAGCHRYDQSAVNLILFSAVERFGPRSQLESNDHDLGQFLEVHRAEQYNGVIPSLFPEKNSSVLNI